MKSKLTNQKVKDIWLKASVVGSLWASVEIIIGSFFHNLRVPFAGTILAMISVAILVAFHQHWKEKGLFWRAGLICALMKSISPSAILLGPMTGILSEALLMELFIRLLGGNFLGYIVGGAIALSSTIAHKIGNLLIIYGFDFVTVLVNLYNYAVKQIGYADLKPEQALWILFGVYALLGITAAIIGLSVGRRTFKSITHTNEIKEILPQGKNTLFELNPDQHFSVKLLFFHLFAIAVCLFIISKISLWAGILFIFSYIGFCIFYYKQSLKHLKRPIFWVQVLILTFLATVFFNGFQKGNLFDTEGLLAGLQMNIRAVLILVGFSSISVELRNPLIKSVLMKRGFSQLYLSLGLAFSALPAVIENFSKPKQILRKPGKSIKQALQNADQLLWLFQSKIMKPKIYILTSNRHEGKTTCASQLDEALRNLNYKNGGFLAPGKFEKKRRSEFNIIDLQTREQKPLCSIHFEKGEEIGPFRFDADGQKFGHDLLRIENVESVDFIFIDEIGPLELKSKGWAPSIDKLMMTPELTMIWIVRKSLVNKVINKWNLLDVEVFDIKIQDAKDIAQKIHSNHKSIDD